MANRIRLLRPDDLLCLEIEFHNLKLNDASCEVRALVREEPERPSFLIVHFPPQAILEQAFLEQEPLPTDGGFDNDKINAGDNYSKARKDEQPGEADKLGFLAKSRLSGPSRLVFRLPEEADYQIEYSVAALLNWSDFHLEVSPVAGLPLNPTRAEIDAAGATRQPNALETAIEYPYRLIVSPNDGVQWGHQRFPVTHAGITELWHTRLLTAKRAAGKHRELSKENQAPLRAVWSPDFEFQDRTFTDILLDNPPFPKANIVDNEPFRASMNGYDRFSIVLNTTAFSGYVNENEQPYKPQPFWAEQFMLSSMGAWLRSRGNWELPYYLRRPIIFQAAPFKPILSANPGFAAADVGASPFQFLANKLNDFYQAPSDILAQNLSLNLPVVHRADKSTTSLSEWVHRSTMGRDHYVRIVYEGFLYPFGHRAALVKVTERKIKKLSNGRLYAMLLQRFFIVVREPLKDYSALHDLTLNPLGTNFGRHMPFKNVRLTTLVTPDIIAPGDASVSIAGADKALWIKVKENGQPTSFRFHAEAEDFSGKQLDFDASMIFVFADGISNSETTPVFAAYANAPNERACPFHNQAVAYVKPGDNIKSENTRFETSNMEFHSVQFLEDVNREYKGFVPFMLSANVKIPALEQILGKPTATQIQFFKGYLKDGLVNEGKVFAELVKPKNTVTNNIPDFDRNPFAAKFEAKQAGGISTPSFRPSSLSESTGPVGGNVEKAADANFDPVEYFPTNLDAKLFGSFDLMDIINVALGSFGKNAPNIVRDIKNLPGGRQEITASMVWEPDLQTKDIGVLTLEADDARARMEARIKQVVFLPPNAPALGETSSEFTGAIEDFNLVFIKVVRLNFEAFRFSSINGKKPDMDVQLANSNPVEFIGALTFVNELKNIIPKGLFGDGVSLDLIPTGIRAGFSFAVPPLAVGVFALKDIVLSAYLTLPFSDGKPTFDFAVSERHKPFNLTVAFLGGGGFFHLQVDTTGVRLLEAALEFGANASIDLGVASGGVHFMAGIYFAMKVEAGKSESELTGYFRCGGEVSVLGIVSISIEFTLSFTYYIDENKAKGRATLEISVEILFFSISVELTIEKGFGGESGDPLFKDVMPQASIWNEYATAFA